MDFGKDFIWGTATASFQVEGGADKRGETVWDMFCRKENAVKYGHDGLIACDHYHRFKEDVAIMKEMGLNAYRLSLSWRRIINEDGSLNEDGVRFYNELIDELLNSGIEPYVTLFHWDYPLDLYHRGGWLNPDSPKWFGEYTKIVTELFSDRVKNWFTLNETQCFISLGHGLGIHAPGLMMSEEEVMRCAHNANRAHGHALAAIRAYSKQKASVGFAPVGSVIVPETDDQATVAAARKRMFEVSHPRYWGNAIWIDPIMLGKYDPELMDYFAEHKISVTDEDMKLIGGDLDFMGMNLYVGERFGLNGRTPLKVGFDMTAIEWEVIPEAIYWGARFYYERYKKPILVTENGMANTDMISADGCVHDPQRIEFMRRYLCELNRAMRDGSEVMGYMHWSLMDNFEWAEGYQKRFGLVYVDYKNECRRIVKDSGKFYADVIKTRGANL